MRIDDCPNNTAFLQFLCVTVMLYLRAFALFVFSALMLFAQIIIRHTYLLLPNLY